MTQKKYKFLCSPEDGAEDALCSFIMQALENESYRLKVRYVNNGNKALHWDALACVGGSPKTMNEKTIQQNIDAVIAEFRKKLAELDDWENNRDIEHPIKGDIYFDGIEVEGWLKDKFREAIQDFIRATEVEEKEAPEKEAWSKKYLGVTIDKNVLAEIISVAKTNSFNAAIAAQKEKIKHYLGT